MNTTLSPLQLKLLHMLKWFHNFCEQNHLRYYAIGGTMLGAMRHQGFIPWDDDVDVGMPTEDYLRFIELMKTNPSGGQYVAESPSNAGEDFWYPFTKLYDTSTTLIENTAAAIKRGIFLDIFPLDGIGNTRREARKNFHAIEFKTNLLNARTTGIRQGRTLLKNWAVRVAQCIPAGILDNKKLYVSLVQACQSRPFSQYKFVGNLVGNAQQKEIFPREIFGTPTLYKFEDMQIYGIEKADPYLTQVYGDWRKFPPLEKQKTHHDFIEINWHKSYLTTEPNPVRVLQIVSSMNQGSGVLAIVKNWHHHIDTSKIQFDYLYFIQTPVTAQKEIEALGGRTYQLPNPAQAPVRFLRESYRFFKTHRYHTVHSHFTSLNFFFYPLAKLFGTKNIIQHAHGTQWSDKKLNGWRNYLMLHSVWPLITHKLACSQAAGKFWYGKNFTVINNAIDIEKFDYNPAVRAQKRKELGLENNFVISHIGRFSPEKNHTFLIDIFAEVAKQEPSARLVLVGNGPLEENIKHLVTQKELQNKVMFLGVRKDVPALLQVADVFVLPSFHEGMPVTGVEAQATGLPCVFADTITPEVVLLPGSCRLSLQDNAKTWADKILSLKHIKRISGKHILMQKKFDIHQTARQVEQLYRELTPNYVSNR